MEIIVTKIINFITSRALNNRQLPKLLKESSRRQGNKKQ